MLKANTSMYNKDYKRFRDDNNEYITSYRHDAVASAVFEFKLVRVRVTVSFT